MATKKEATKKPVARRPRATEARDTAPRYRVLTQSFIDNRLLEAGSETVYWGVPGRFLQPLNAAAQANKNAAKEIRTDPGYENQSREEVQVARTEALRDLDNDLQGVTPEEGDVDYGDIDIDETDLRGGLNNDALLPQADRAELERHAQASVDATREKEADDTNFVRVKLQGNPTGVETPASQQGATPVLDSQGKGNKPAK